MRRKEIINVTNAPKCWGCDGCHCSQFLPFWLRRRAPFPQDDILSLCPCPTDTFLDQYMSMWSSSAGPPLDPLPGNQSFWDRPGLLTDRALIESSLGSHQENREIVDPIFSIQVRAYSSRKSGVFSSTTLNLISELGRRIYVLTQEMGFHTYSQRISVTIQRFNSVLLHDTLPVDLPDL